MFGVLVAFEKARNNSHFLQKIAAFVSRGPYCHCEYLFCEFSRAENNTINIVACTETYAAFMVSFFHN